MASDLLGGQFLSKVHLVNPQVHESNGELPLPPTSFCDRHGLVYSVGYIVQGEFFASDSD